MEERRSGGEEKCGGEEKWRRREVEKCGEVKGGKEKEEEEEKGTGGGIQVSNPAQQFYGASLVSCATEIVLSIFF